MEATKGTSAIAGICSFFRRLIILEELRQCHLSPCCLFFGSTRLQVWDPPPAGLHFRVSVCLSASTPPCGILTRNRAKMAKIKKRLADAEDNFKKADKKQPAGMVQKLDEHC